MLEECITTVVVDLSSKRNSRSTLLGIALIRGNKATDKLVRARANNPCFNIGRNGCLVYLS